MKSDIDCREVSRLISDGQEKALPQADQARLRLHLAICEACRDVEEQLALLRKAMRQLGKDKLAER